MARYHAAVESRSPAAETFGYLATFSNAADWDRGVLAGEQLDPGPAGGGSRFRLVVPFVGVRMSLTYEVIRFVPDREVLLHAANGVLQATDRIVVTGTADGSTVSYRPRGGCGAHCGCSTPSRGRVSAPWPSARPPGLPRPCPAPAGSWAQASRAAAGSGTTGAPGPTTRCRGRARKTPVPHASSGTIWPRRPPRTHRSWHRQGGTPWLLSMTSLRRDNDDRAAAV